MLSAGSGMREKKQYQEERAKSIPLRVSLQEHCIVGPRRYQIYPGRSSKRGSGNSGYPDNGQIFHITSKFP